MGVLEPKDVKYGLDCKKSRTRSRSRAGRYLPSSDGRTVYAVLLTTLRCLGMLIWDKKKKREGWDEPGWLMWCRGYRVILCRGRREKRKGKRIQEEGKSSTRPGPGRSCTLAGQSISSLSVTDRPMYGWPLASTGVLSRGCRRSPGLGDSGREKSKL